MLVHTCNKAVCDCPPSVWQVEPPYERNVLLPYYPEIHAPKIEPDKFGFLSFVTTEDLAMVQAEVKRLRDEVKSLKRALKIRRYNK